MTTNTDADKAKITDQKAEPPEPPKESAIGIGLLLLNLSLSSHAAQTLLKPLFGKTLGTLSFYFGLFVSFGLFSSLVPNTAKTQRRALVALSVLQAVSALFARGAGAYASVHIADPMLAALATHSLLSYPAIGLGGVVWLQWMETYSDPEPTAAGQLAIRSFTCVALAVLLGYAEPLVGSALLKYVNLPPNTTLICLAMASYSLSTVFQPGRAISPPQPGQATKLIAVLSLFVALVAVNVPPYTPEGLAVASQRYTPHGLVQVVDNLPARHLRVDATILGSAELSTDGAEPTVGDTLDAAVALQDAVRLVKGTAGKRALVIGAKTGAAAKHLIWHQYNTTLVEAERAVYAAARAQFALPEPDTVTIDDAAHWVHKRAKAHPAPGGTAAPDAHWVHKFAKDRPARGGDVAPDAQFDVVVHDVFEGGELPAELFTMDFWAALRRLVDDKGVVAVNFVGKPGAITFKSTLNMLQATFTTCKALHPGPLKTPPLSTPDEILEIVIFCTPAPALDFRKAARTDLAKGSALRRDVLTSLPKREVSIAAALGDTPRERFLLRAGEPKAKHWGTENVAEYWKLMRQRYPASLWSSY